MTKLTENDSGLSVYVNLKLVKYMCWIEEEKCTKLKFSDDTKSLRVKETPEEILYGTDY